MPYMDDFTNPERHIIPPCWAGEISNDVFSAGEDLFVRIPGIDSGRSKWGPCRWTPQIDDSGNVVYPSDGDAALIVKDDIGEYWILMWWQYG